MAGLHFIKMSNNLMATDETCATIVDCLATLSEKVVEKVVERSIEEFKETVVHYTSEDIFDEMKSDRILKAQLEEIKYEAIDLKRKFKDIANSLKSKWSSSKVGNLRKTAKGRFYLYKKRPQLRILKKKMADNVEKRKKQLSAAGMCGRLLKLASNFQHMVNSAGDILTKRVAELDCIYIMHKDDYYMAVEAKKAGFEGDLVLSDTLSGITREAVERVAISKGFKVRRETIHKEASTST